MVKLSRHPTDRDDAEQIWPELHEWLQPGPNEGRPEVTSNSDCARQDKQSGRAIDDEYFFRSYCFSKDCDRYRDEGSTGKQPESNGTRFCQAQAGRGDHSCKAARDAEQANEQTGILIGERLMQPNAEQIAREERVTDRAGEAQGDGALITGREMTMSILRGHRAGERSYSR